MAKLTRITRDDSSWPVPDYCLVCGRGIRELSWRLKDAVFPVMHTRMRSGVSLLSPAGLQCAAAAVHTEIPFSSKLDFETRAGTLCLCAGCALPLFSSETKYDSHTGWHRVSGGR